MNTEKGQDGCSQAQPCRHQIRQSLFSAPVHLRFHVVWKRRVTWPPPCRTLQMEIGDINMRLNANISEQGDFNVKLLQHQWRRSSHAVFISQITAFETDHSFFSHLAKKWSTAFKMSQTYLISHLQTFTNTFAIILIPVRFVCVTRRTVCCVLQNESKPNNYCLVLQIWCVVLVFECQVSEIMWQVKILCVNSWKEKR